MNDTNKRKESKDEKKKTRIENEIKVGIDTERSV